MFIANELRLCQNATMEDNFHYTAEQIRTHEYALDTYIVINVVNLLISSVLSVFLWTDFCIFEIPVIWHDKSRLVRLFMRNISVMHSKWRTCALVAILTRGQDQGHLRPGLWPRIICKFRYLLHTQNSMIGNLGY